MPPSFNSPIMVTPFCESHQSAVIDLIVHIQRNEFHIDITADDQPDLNRIPEFYQTGNGNFWVACHDNRVVGTIALLDIGNHQAALRKMFVRAGYRGKSFGTAGTLLNTLIQWAGTRSIKEIFLGTTPMFLAAHRFYEKNGFREIPKSDLPEAFPVMHVDTKFYTKNVEPQTLNSPGKTGKFQITKSK